MWALHTAIYNFINMDIYNCINCIEMTYNFINMHRNSECIDMHFSGLCTQDVSVGHLNAGARIGAIASVQTFCDLVHQCTLNRCYELTCSDERCYELMCAVMSVTVSFSSMYIDHRVVRHWCSDHCTYACHTHSDMPRSTHVLRRSA